MNELQQCLQELDNVDKETYPLKEINYIKEHFEEAKPYLYDALDEARNMIDNDNDEFFSHELYIYALYLLAEMKDKEAFSKIIYTFSFTGKDAFDLFGEIITEDLQNILYATYDDNYELLKESIADDSLDEFVRLSMLDTYMQLYLDGTELEYDVVVFLKSLIYSDNDDDPVKGSIADYICQCHLIDMLEDIKYLDEHDLIDISISGAYDGLVDCMFDYRYEEGFCKVPVDTYECMKHSYMFEEEQSHKDIEKMRKKFNLEYKRQENQATKKIKKIGRNDPCPCGSGKKYKKCCMNKDAKLNTIEDFVHRTLALEDYPKLRNNQNDNRIYIDDFFDEESIEIDRILYLGLYRFSQYSNSINFKSSKGDIAEERKCLYLLLAFDKYVEKFNKEGLSSNKAYDKKYSIHYDTKYWLKELLEILDKDDVKYNEIKEYYNR